MSMKRVQDDLLRHYGWVPGRPNLLSELSKRSDNGKLNWCGIGLAFFAERSGVKDVPTVPQVARNWLKVGTEVVGDETTWRQGDVMVFRRLGLLDWQAHVTTYLALGPDNIIYCLGCNQGGMISVSKMDRSKLLGVRHLGV